ncbi:type IV secretory system conjugative DNA transfer family protein [Roseivirga pacifica]|uniref:type IV secretory system conjugative DNA transfer family protein n=1 Tax=Roseivirga pacifica TaxID=1267423 RepID=UPI003BAC3B3B
MGYYSATGANRHGSARWLDEGTKDRLFGQNSGVHIGGGWSFNGQGNLLTVGGSRSGKGASVVMQNFLLDWYKGSMVVIDPKGEYAAVSAKYNKEVRNRKTYIIDPWGTQNNENVEHGIQGVNFNPLDLLDPESEDVIDDCDMIAEMLVPNDKSSSKDSHWEDKARQWISSYLLHIVTFDGYRKQDAVTLHTLRSLFKRPQASLKSENLDGTNFEVFAEMQVNDACNGLIIESGKEFMSIWEQEENREAQSILSTVQRALDVFKSPALVKNMQYSELDILDFANTPMTIYITIPPDRLETHYTWLRLLIGSFIKKVQRSRSQGEGNRVLMILEEFYSLGYISMIDKAMGLMPGYDLQLWPVLQDLNQLKKAYGESWETFVANTAVQSFLGIRDNFTAEYVSKKLGKFTDYYTERRSAEQGGTRTESWARDLMTPDEVMESKMITIFHQDGRPFQTAPSPYYEVPAFRVRRQSSPFHRKIPWMPYVSGNMSKEKIDETFDKIQALQEGETFNIPELQIAVRRTGVAEFQEVAYTYPKTAPKKAKPKKKIRIGHMLFLSVFWVFFGVWVYELFHLGIEIKKEEPSIIYGVYDIINNPSALPDNADDPWAKSHYNTSRTFFRYGFLAIGAIFSVVGLIYLAFKARILNFQSTLHREQSRATRNAIKNYEQARVRRRF